MTTNNPDGWPKGLPVEDSRRIDDFLAALDKLEWTTVPAEAYERLANQALRLIVAEIRYYYTRRRRSALLSRLVRAMIWFFGSLGAIAPVVAPFIAPPQGGNSPILQLGYVALALAGAAAAFDRLFTVSANHSRYVTTQYELEALISLFKLDWEEWRAATSADDKHRKKGFELLRDLLRKAYAIIGGETRAWSAELIENLEAAAKKAKV